MLARSSSVRLGKKSQKQKLLVDETQSHHLRPVLPSFGNERSGGPGVAWWGVRGGLHCGTLAGRVTTAGWNWQIASQREVWLWLNIEGEGLIWGESDRFFMKSGMFALTGGDPTGTWSCLRHPGKHRVAVVRMSSAWLRERVGGDAVHLHQGLAGWLSERGRVAFCGLMGVWEKELCDALDQAERAEGLYRLHAEARILDWAAHRLFRRSNVDTTMPVQGAVKRALQILRSHIDEPLDLTALSREVGVSPHHLSRLVRAESGLTLQHHLRRLRIEHACGLLESGRANVTEAALACGYLSLSHFAKAFREETGRTPREWLAGIRNG